MLVLTPKGFYCPAGDFYIDPSRAVGRAVITHAHSDHARRGSKEYYCAQSGASLLQVRVGENAAIQAVPYRKKIYFRDVAVSFHPAGHILGSAQIRVEFCGEVWVVSGDYKRDTDPTCETFETLTCDVFITEATFGTPSFKWDKTIDHGTDILDWWHHNKRLGLNSVLFAYSLGKAQRILGCLHNKTSQYVICHTSTETLNQCYRAEGVNLVTTASIENLKSASHGELFLVPPAFLKSPQRNLLGKHYKTAFASGWMARYQKSYDKSFLMSDHADWEGLITTILATKAKRVYVQHRGSGALVRELKSLGLKAFPEAALSVKDPRQLAFL